jgi:hypothetical protein
MNPTTAVKYFVRVIRCSFTERRCILCPEEVQVTCPVFQHFEEKNKKEKLCQ